MTIRLLPMMVVVVMTVVMYRCIFKIFYSVYLQESRRDSLLEQEAASRLVQAVATAARKAPMAIRFVDDGVRVNLPILNAASVRFGPSVRGPLNKYRSSDRKAKKHASRVGSLIINHNCISARKGRDRHADGQTPGRCVTSSAIHRVTVT